MTLREIIAEIGLDEFILQIRTILEMPDSDGKIDVFSGMCRYEHGNLISMDDKYYSMSDEYEKWELQHPGEKPMLIVWSDKRWGQ